ncbi:hypothetical protein AGMMS49975_22760 [Clostridia bacterium]|nr:hypothetical protein AGMMS49975_22760 [Clostridia bacterium]
MSLNYNLTGAARKAFAQAVGEILNQSVVYMGTPTFAFNVGGYIIDRNGALSCDESAGTGQLPRLAAMLRECGYTAENADDISEEFAEAAEEVNGAPDFNDLRLTEREELGLRQERRDPRGEDGMQSNDVPEPDNNALVIELPLSQFSIGAIDNIRKIVASKAVVIKRALSAEDLPIEVTEDRIRFPWFTLTGAYGEAEAYGKFVCAIGDMAKRQRRVIAKPCEVVNEKFIMRVFLIRLGFSGPEFRTARKILLRNLTGNGSWKNGCPPERNTTSSAVESGEMEDVPYEKQ